MWLVLFSNAIIMKPEEISLVLCALIYGISSQKQLHGSKSKLILALSTFKDPVRNPFFAAKIHHRQKCEHLNNSIVYQCELCVLVFVHLHECQSRRTKVSSSNVDFQMANDGVESLNANTARYFRYFCRF